jgi:glucose/arabinose dehydrogenase/mono/diheme cytochrome c family protein
MRITILLTLLLCANTQAQLGNREGHIMPPPPAEWDIPEAPALSPGQTLDTLTVPKGFRVDLVAGDPLVNDPVCLAFDEDGRMWVCEMTGYMPDLEGTGEEEKVGNIVILEDTDGDGVADKRTVFLDKLVLPRAIAHVEGGILFADHSSLYYVANKNDKPGYKQIVDPEFTAGGGNVEHKTNGLFHALDNWIYNAKSSKRYRKIDDLWVSEETEFRGQWGISQDDQGRLVTNTNSNLLNFELLPPGVTQRNPHHDFKSKASVNTSNAVFPSRINPGINRGYMEEMLTKDGYLTKATGACGLTVYRGDQFPPEFYGNIFIPEPCGNLVKRVILTGEGTDLVGEHAYPDREFFTSTDERSRIVNSYTAPDGSLYLVDFYRGIIQHKTYVTTFLWNQIVERKLESPLGLGRIYRVAYENNALGPQPRMSGQSGAELVRHLTHPNGWWRDTAQRLIVQRSDRDAIPALEKLASDPSQPLGQIHALWSLEGLGALAPNTLAGTAAASNDPRVLSQVIRVAETLARSDHDKAAFEVVRDIAKNKPPHPDTDLQLAISLGLFDHDDCITILNTVLDRRQESRLFTDVALTGLAGSELAMLQYHLDKKSLLQELLIAAIAKSKNQANIDAALALLPDDLRDSYATKIAKTNASKKNQIKSAGDKALYELGMAEYQKLCLACHQLNGQGLTYIAPPLVDSEWVNGPAGRLIAIALDGVTGPIEVAGKNYEAPAIQPLMPGLRINPELDDKKIAAMLTYVRNTWGNSAKPISGKEVAKVRKATADRALPYTAVELKNFKL